jgi:hypothetical protein
LADKYQSDGVLPGQDVLQLFASVGHEVQFILSSLQLLHLGLVANNFAVVEAICGGGGSGGGGECLEWPERNNAERDGLNAGE